MLPVQKFPPPPPRLAPKNLKKAAKKAFQARAETEKLRELADKNWKRMGNLEEFQRNQYERQNQKYRQEAGRAPHNKYHHPMGPIDYSKGLFMRDLLAPTMQMRG